MEEDVLLNSRICRTVSMFVWLLFLFGLLLPAIETNAVAYDGEYDLPEALKDTSPSMDGNETKSESAPITPLGSSSDPKNPSIATDSQGYAHIVWEEEVSGNDEIFYEKVDRFGNVIISPHAITDALDDSDGPTQFGPVVAVAPDDTVYVFFANQHVMSGRMDYYNDGKVSVDGGNSWIDLNTIPGTVYVWCEAPNPPRDIVDRARPIDVDIDDNGLVHLVWSMFYHYTENDEQDSVQYTKGTPTGPPGGMIWSIPVDLFSYDYQKPYQDHYNAVRFPRIAKGRTVVGPPPADDYVHVIFSFDETPCRIGVWCPGDTYVKYEKSTDNGVTWPWPPPLPGPQTIGWTSYVPMYNNLVADRTARETGVGGAVYATWENYIIGNDIDVFFMRSTNDGDLWPMSPDTVAGGPGRQRHPDIDIDSGGFVHLVWLEYHVNDCRIHHNVAMDAYTTRVTNWHHATRLRQSTYLSTPVISVESRDLLHMAWRDKEATEYVVYYDAFPKEMEITQTSADSYFPSVAADSSGNTHMVWEDMRDGDKDIYYMRIDQYGVATWPEKNLVKSVEEEHSPIQYGPVIAIAPDDTIWVFYLDQEIATQGSLITYNVIGKKNSAGGDPNSWDDYYDIDYDTYFYSDIGGSARDPVDWARPIDADIGDDGTIHLVWARFHHFEGTPEDTENLYYGKSENEGDSWTWQGDGKIFEHSYVPGWEDHYNAIRYPRIAKGRNVAATQDFVHVIFSLDETPCEIGYWCPGTTYVKYLRSSDNGDNWPPSPPTGPKTIGTTGYVAMYNNLVADRTTRGTNTGAVYATWEDYQTDLDVFVVRNLDDGDWTSWEIPVMVVGGAGRQRQPDLGIDSQGYVHLLFYSGSSTVSNIHHMASIDPYLSTPGAPHWSPERAFTFVTDRICSQPVVAITPSYDNMKLAWHQKQTVYDVYHLSWF